ncbi:MAG: hypothetical protein IT204_07275 [Fimbriimonadaceae bacterium]|nr:hypothetical protein [Fimbriimonadaceae bacterium]
MRTGKRALAVALLTVGVLSLAGCKKKDDWGAEIGAPAADVNSIRAKSKAKKGAPAQPGQPAAPAAPGSP